MKDCVTRRNNWNAWYLQIVTAQMDQDIQMAKEAIKKKHEEKRKVISYTTCFYKDYGITSKAL